MAAAHVLHYEVGIPQQKGPRVLKTAEQGPVADLHQHGTMVTDRGPSYDAKELDEVKQQKCNAHVLRSIDAVLVKKKGKARTFGVELKRLIKESIQLWKDYRNG
jgi:hypothetical protein